MSEILGKLFLFIIVFGLLPYFVSDLGLAAMGLDLVTFLSLYSICQPHPLFQRTNFTFNMFCLWVWQNGLGPSWTALYILCTQAVCTPLYNNLALALYILMQRSSMYPIAGEQGWGSYAGILINKWWGSYAGWLGSYAGRSYTTQNFWKTTK